MKATVNFRVEVFRRAYEIAKATDNDFGTCLSQSWDLYRLAKQMKNEVITFAYIKKDGTRRTAHGTLKETILPQPKGTTDRNPNAKVFTYFDTDKQQFRAFNVQNFIGVC